MKAKETNDVALACHLSAMDPSQSKRHDELVREFFANFQETQELPNGYGFTLPGEAEWYRKLAEWVTLERLCCPFLSFEQGFSEDGKVWLHLTGDEDVKQFLRSYLNQ
jgi:hypothetical protein